MKISCFRAFVSAFLLVTGICGATSATAQTVPAAFRSPFSLNVGGEVSAYQADWYSSYGFDTHLAGIGAYADLGVWRGLGVEGEARWLRFHQYYNVHQDNYLIGPRYKPQLLHFWRAQGYVKGLIGFSNMDLGPDAFDPTKDDNGRFTTYALGGGLDIKMTRRWTVRLPDFEYQKYPYFGSGTLTPYGASIGVAYKIF